MCVCVCVCVCVWCRPWCSLRVNLDIGNIDNIMISCVIDKQPFGGIIYFKKKKTP